MRVLDPSRDPRKAPFTGGEHWIYQAAADGVYDLAGATAIFQGGPFERRFRDIHAVSQQVQHEGAEAPILARARVRRTRS